MVVQHRLTGYSCTVLCPRSMKMSRMWLLIFMETGTLEGGQTSRQARMYREPRSWRQANLLEFFEINSVTACKTEPALPFLQKLLFLIWVDD